MKPKKSVNEMRLLYVSRALSVISEETSSPLHNKAERSNKHEQYLKLINVIWRLPDSFTGNSNEK